MKTIVIFLFIALSTITNLTFGQYLAPDSTALEAVIVEPYYISDENDATDEDGGYLALNSVTYRVFVDLKPGYRLQAVYGNPKHEMRISTTTDFFNNEDRGEIVGKLIEDQYLDEGTVALDSWVAMGGATDGYYGIPKNIDDDGSVIGGLNNNGGSENLPQGLLINENNEQGMPLTSSDGLMEGEGPTVTVVGLDLGIFDDENDGPLFTTNSGAWSVLEGMTGPTDDNVILIGQFTTTGEFCFKLNIQVGIPDSLVCDDPDCHVVIQYVAEVHPDEVVSSVATDNIFVFEDLNACFLVVPDAVVETTLIETEMQVYPNPASDIVNFTIAEAKGNDTHYEIYDANGRMVLSQNIVVNGGQIYETIDISALSDGLYLLKVSSQEFVASKMISKF